MHLFETYTFLYTFYFIFFSTSPIGFFYHESHNPVKGSSAILQYGTDKLDLVFLFHASPDIDTTEWASYQRFMTDVISGANIDSGDVQVGAIIYNYEASWNFPLNQYTTKSSLAQAINDLPPWTDSSANVADGMDNVRLMFTSRGGDRPDVPNAVIVVTNSDANYQVGSIGSSAQRLKTESNARIYTAGIGLRGSSQLPSIASARSTVFSADDTAGLSDMKEDIVAQMPPCKMNFFHAEMVECNI